MAILDLHYDVVVIGSGPGGYIAAIRSAQLGLKTACIEKNKTLGGTCLNIGCIPSKALLSSSEFYEKCRKQSEHHGIKMEGLSFNWQEMMARKDKIVGGFTKGIESLFHKNQVQWIKGTAILKSSSEIVVGDQVIHAKNIILATGSSPQQLSNIVIDEKTIVSSTGALCLQSIPKRLVVVGAGVIGVELGSVYNRLGSEVIFIEYLDRICSSFDGALSKGLQKSLTLQGMSFHLSHKVEAIEGKELIAKGPLGQLRIPFDVVLVSVGRKPYVKELGLEKVGISLDSKGFIPVDGSFRTSLKNVFAIGDLIDGPMLAHKASEEGIMVAEMIAGHRPAFDYVSIPNVIYTHPEVASVGFSEEELKEKQIGYKVGQFPFKANSRARCLGDDEGFVKILAETKSHRVLGVHILGPNASEMIATAAHALVMRSTVDQLIATCFAHPTLSEAIKEAALSTFGKPIHL